MCMCGMCACECMGGICMMYAHVCARYLSVYIYTESRRGFGVYFSITVWIIPLKQGLPLNLELGWQTVSFSIPPVSTPHSTGVRGVCGYTQLFHECWGFKLRSSRLCSKSSQAVSHRYFPKREELLMILELWWQIGGHFLFL